MPKRRLPLAWLLALLGACGTDNRASLSGGPAGAQSETSSVSSCTVPNTGCACSDEGSRVDCGHVAQRFSDYVTCAMGTRTCSGGVWSACQSERLTVKAASLAPSQAPQSLGSTAACPDGFDVCDPYCNLFPDTAGGFSAGTGFSNTPGGLTLVGTLPQTCTSLTLTPSVSSITMSGNSVGALSASPVTFTLTAAPSGCTQSPFQTTWYIDKFDRATITGSNDSDGSLVARIPIGGPIQVTAYALGLSATTTVQLKVNVLEAPSGAAAAPNQAASATQISAFGSVSAPSAGSGASSATWLYPYAATYFPLGLPAPVPQYRYALAAGDSTSAASAVKVSIRYPSGSTAASASFNYSIVVKENNAVTCTASPTLCNYLDPQVVIPQSAWQYFEQAARGQDADLVVQRLRARSSGSDQLELESARTIHIVDGKLKGTVYYNSYTSPQGGNTGAILSIAPGATSPTLAVQPNGTCSTCHSINVDGTRLITNGGVSSGSYSYDQSEQYDLTSSAPAPTVLQTYTNNRYSFGGPWLDGSLYMSHGGTSDPQWHSPTAASLLYRPTDSVNSVTLSNWPTNVQAVTPRFSPNGKKLGFGFWSGNSLPCSSSAISPCSGSPRTLPSVSGGTRLAVMDFTCSSPPCTSASTGWSVSNARDVTPGVTDRVAWPSFNPAGSAVAYQRQIRSSKSILSWTPSNIGTVAGALAEIWLSNIPSDGSTAATPTRLLALNGLSSAGTSYLPQQARSIVVDSDPLYKFRIARYEMSQSVTSGSAGPSITLTGATTGGPWDFRIKVVTGGSVGSAKIQYSTNGGSSWSTSFTTAATPVPLTSGIQASFASGTYSTASTYQTLVGRVGLQGTPTGGPWDVRLQIVGTGALNTATFKYSTDGGTTWSSTLTTAATVTLGSTGLVATFASVTYSSSAWGWGATVSHYHQDNAQFTVIEADNCSNNAPLSTASDYAVNYLPSFAPTDVGGKSWVVFTSRRMYGNVAYEDGWDPEPGYACGSGKTPTKKLWIAAVDSTVTPGTDPSHPAFYLPGQELAAGNSDGHWVNAACTAVGQACESDDDCCGGTGASPTTQCRITDATTSPATRLCQQRSACAPAGTSCTATTDCCSGLTCPSGGGLCLQSPNSLLYDTQTLTREYVASCPNATKPKWRFFLWQDTIPNGTSIEFKVQTKQAAADSYSPATALLYATATQSSSGSTWLQGSTPIDDLLVKASWASQAYLLVTMVFHPNSSGNLAPTLLAWKQTYDCVPSE
jgi:hypothetical protein